MRFHLLAFVLMAGTALPAAAQQRTVEQRVGKIEQELRAVQRKVFPGGAGATLEPEIRQEVRAAPAAGTPASSAVADLTSRIDALEAQLSSLTGQIEQTGFRTRQLEEAFAQYRANAEARMAEMEKARAAPVETAAVVQQPEAAPAKVLDQAKPAAKPAATVAAADPIEEADTRGFRLWEERRLADAQTALEAFARKYPKHMRASYARNLAGRAYMDEGKLATAAKLFLNNYQTDPKGERAPDSLLYLGEALVKLGKPAEACKVYDELQDVYGPTLRDMLKQRLPKARQEAKCG
jgi:TolA-binding protein